MTQQSPEPKVSTGSLLSTLANRFWEYYNAHLWAMNSVGVAILGVLVTFLWTPVKTSMGYVQNVPKLDVRVTVLESATTQAISKLSDQVKQYHDDTIGVLHKHDGKLNYLSGQMDGIKAMLGHATPDQNAQADPSDERLGIAPPGDASSTITR